MGQHRGSGRGPHVVEHVSHLDAADQAAALGLRIDRLRRRQLEGGWSAGRADEIHTLEGAYDALRALVDRRHAGPIQGSTPGELALAGAAPERIFRALLDDVASDLEAGGDPAQRAPARRLGVGGLALRWEGARRDVPHALEPEVVAERRDLLALVVGGAAILRSIDGHGLSTRLRPGRAAAGASK